MIRFLLILLLVLTLAGCKKDSANSGYNTDYASKTEWLSDPDAPDDPNPNYHSPEPGTIALLGIGISGLIASALRRRRRSKLR